VTDQLVDVEVQATSVVSLAMVHNRVPLVRAVRLTNHGGERRGAAVRVAIHDDEGRLSRPWEALVDLPEDGSVELTEVDLRMDGDAMLQLEERRPGTVRVAVEHHDVIVVDREPLQRGVAVVGTSTAIACRRSPFAMVSASSRSSSTTNTRTTASCPVTVLGGC